MGAAQNSIDPLVDDYQPLQETPLKSKKSVSFKKNSYDLN